MKRKLLAVIGILAILSGLLPGSVLASAVTSLAPAPTSPSTIYLPVLFRPAPPKSSFELIEEAFRAGELDAETALIYQMYAITLDPRLPERYRGVDKDDLESNALREVVRRWDSLSAEAQALLAPFLTPPGYEGSWADPATAWRAARGSSSAMQAAASPASDPDPLAKYCWSGGYPPFPEPQPGWEQLKTAHTTIWYQTIGDVWPSGTPLATPEQTKATAEAAAAVIEHIIKQEIDLMGQEHWPLPDTNEPCSGGDGSIDIYVSRKNTKMGAQAVPFPPGEVLRPGYLWLAPDYIDGDLKTVRDVLAHEFFHLISLSYPQAREESELELPEYAWLDEATANWMIDYVYKDDQFEHEAAADYLHRDHLTSLEWTMERDSKNGYSDYVFLQFLVMKLGAQVIPAIWDATPKLDSLAAINEATKGAGGFEELWPEFALAAWNDWQNGFLDDLYHWDHLEAGISGENGFPNIWAPQQVQLDGKRRGYQNIYGGGVIQHVAIGMSRHVFGDPAVRSVLFTNTLVGVRGAHIWALLKIAGKWQVEDWTEKRYRQFCRQRDSERVEEIVILISNSVFDDRTYELEPPVNGDYPVLEFTNLACDEWQGTVTAVYRDDGGTRHDLETIQTSASFEADPEWSSEGNEFAMFQLKQGTMHWEFTGTMGDCQIQADPVDWTLEPPYDGGLSIRQWRDDVSLIGQYEGSGTSSYQPTLTFVCPEATWQQPWQTMPWLSTGPMGTNNARVSDDGQTIAGRYEWGTPGDGRSWTVEWNFVAVPPGE